MWRVDLELLWGPSFESRSIPLIGKVAVSVTPQGSWCGAVGTRASPTLVMPVQGGRAAGQSGARLAPWARICFLQEASQQDALTSGPLSPYRQ